MAWRKSFLSWKGKKIPLELHLVHINPQTGKITIIIFPLSLDKTVESFSLTDITNTIDTTQQLNLLFKDESDVPSLRPNSTNIGKILSLNLCDPAKIILQEPKFFFLNTSNNESLLIASPKSFNREIGLKIMNYLLYYTMRNIIKIEFLCI